MRCGIDLGGTKTEAVILDDTGEIIWRTREATPAENYHAILEFKILKACIFGQVFKLPMDISFSNLHLPGITFDRKRFLVDFRWGDDRDST